MVIFPSAVKILGSACRGIPPGAFHAKNRCHPNAIPATTHFSEERDPITTLIFPNFGLDKGANLNSHNNINTQHRHCLSLVIASTSSLLPHRHSRKIVSPCKVAWIPAFAGRTMWRQ